MNTYHHCRMLLVSSLILSLFGIAPLIGQTNYSKRKATRNYSVGVGIAGGAGMIISPPDGLKVGPLLATRFGVDASLPVSGTVTPMLSLGLDNRGTELHAESNSDAYTLTKTSYFYLTPGITFSSFYLGLNIGLPMGGATELANGTSIDFSDADKDKMLTVLEPRIGAVIPVVDEEIGWLGIVFSGGYNLNPMFDYQEDLPDNAGNFQSVSAHLGITWQFAIPNTGLK
ncbi:MAG: hypothetical protein IT211_04830 [Armatimonadetes bacterium]|nr:hypothetical protein [Armatimonadota bacterium]